MAKRKSTKRRSKNTKLPVHYPRLPWADKGIQIEQAHSRSTMLGADPLSRHLIHELWLPLVMSPIGDLEHALHKLTLEKFHGMGLTEGERATINRARQDIVAIRKNLEPMYYRLKQ